MLRILGDGGPGIDHIPCSYRLKELSMNPAVRLCTAIAFQASLAKLPGPRGVLSGVHSDVWNTMRIRGNKERSGWVFEYRPTAILSALWVKDWSLCLQYESVIFATNMQSIRNFQLFASTILDKVQCTGRELSLWSMEVLTLFLRRTGKSNLQIDCVSHK